MKNYKEEIEILSEKLSDYLDDAYIWERRYKNIDVEKFCLQKLEGYRIESKEKLKKTTFWKEACEDFENEDDAIEREASLLLKKSIIEKNLNEIITNAIKLSIQAYFENSHEDFTEYFEKFVILRRYNTDEACAIITQITKAIEKENEA